MSKRNGYKIIITDTSKLNEIVTALEETDISVEVSEPIQGQDTRSITAEDAPSAGTAFGDHSKNPGRYIYWNEIKQALQPHTDAIKQVKHTLSDDTGCYTKVTEYETRNGSFKQVRQEKQEDRIR